MKILTWNLACLPKNINFLRNPYNVIDKIINTLLEKNADIAIKWFTNNQMKMNPDKCHLLIGGHKWEMVWNDVSF